MKQPYFNSDLVGKIGGGANALGAASKAFIDIGDIKQKKEDRDKNDKRYDAEFDLKKAAVDQDKKDRSAKVSAFRKIHPKTTDNLTDDEVYQMGDYINKIHTDKSPMKFIESFTAQNGDRVAIFYDGGKDEKGDPTYKNVVLGKAKDYQKSNGGNKGAYGYGVNPDGTSKTAKQFGEEQAKNRAIDRKKLKDLGNMEIK